MNTKIVSKWRQRLLALPLIGGLLASMGAAAGPLGFVPDYPRTQLLRIATTALTYDVGGAAPNFNLDFVPTTVSFDRGSLPGDYLNASGSIQIQLASDGSVIDGVGGFVMQGDLDADADGTVDYSGVLLTGDVLAVAAEDGGLLLGYIDLRVQITGGLTASFYGDDNLGVVLNFENAPDFEGNFLNSFSASFVKGTLGGVPSICIDLTKEISVDGGSTWFDANDDAAPVTAQVGTAIEYQLTVHNCGTSALENAVVTDNYLPGAPNSYDVPGTLAPDESRVLTSGAVSWLAPPQAGWCHTPGDFPNVARVDANRVGAPDDDVTDTDPAYLSCFEGPAIEVVKEVRVGDEATGTWSAWFDANTPGSGPTGLVISDAEYRIIVRNLSHEFSLVDPVVNDSTLGIVDVTLAGVTLAPNDDAPGGPDEIVLEHDSFAALGNLLMADACNTNAIGERMNTAEVDATPVPVDPNVIDYPDNVDDNDPAYRVCQESNIELLKQVRRKGSGGAWLDADLPGAALELAVGDVAEYRFIVTNLGSVDLSNVVITDNDLTPAINLFVGDLAANTSKTLTSGESGVIEVEYTCGQDPAFNNVATVNGEDPFGNNVSDDDPANVACKDTGIKLVKEVCVADCGNEANWFDANDDVNYTDVPPVQTAPADAEYRVTVTNTGALDLINVEVSDPAIFNPPTTVIFIGNLVAGQTVQIDAGDSAVYTNADMLYVANRCDSEGDIENIAKVDGAVELNGNPVEDTDPALVRCELPDPVCEIKVDLDAQVDGYNQAGMCTDVTYTYTVTNLGDDAQVTLEDDTFDLGLAPFDLDSGDTRNDITYMACITADTTNTATATAKLGGTTVSCSDTSTVTTNVGRDWTCGETIEAEDGVLSGGFSAFSDASASGGEAIRAYSDGMASYQFNLPVDQAVKFIGTVRGPDGGSNSFFFTLNGGEMQLWDTPTGSNYGDDYLSDRGGLDPFFANLAAGDHELVLKFREGGTRLDKLTMECNDRCEEKEKWVQQCSYSSSYGQQCTWVKETYVECSDNCHEEEYWEQQCSYSSSYGQQCTWVKKTRTVCDGDEEPPVLTCGDVVEAEDGLLSGGFEVFNDSNASGGKAIRAFNDGSAEFTIKLDESQTVSLQAKVRGPDSGSNSFFVDLHGESYLWDTPVNSYYKEDFVSDRNGMDPVKVDLDAGQHSLKLKFREGGTRLDRFTVKCEDTCHEETYWEQQCSYSSSYGQQCTWVEKTRTVCEGQSGSSGTEHALINKRSGKALDVPGASTQNGKDLIQWGYHGGDNQRWVFEDLGNGYHRIKAKHSGLCLDVEGSSATADGADVQQVACNDGYDKQWKLIDVGSGYYKLKARHSGKCLRVEGASQDNGAGIVQWTCRDWGSQKWKLQ